MTTINAAVTPLSLDDIRSLTADLIPSLTATVEQVQEHEHPAKGGDLFCLNLTSFMGERMATVLHRLTAEVAEVDRLRAELAIAERDLALAINDRNAMRVKLDGPCGSCHPCTNWADETWRAAGRKPPTVQEWDDLRAQAAATPSADITDRELLIGIRQWLRDEGWWLGWTGWTDQFGELASTVIVDWDEDELRVRRRTAEQAGKSWPVGYGRHERYPATSVRQAVDILCALEVLPPRFSSAYRAAMTGGAQ